MSEHRIHLRTEAGHAMLRRVPVPVLAWRTHRQAPETPATMCAKQQRQDRVEAREALDLIEARQRAAEVRRKEAAAEVESASLRELARLARPAIARMKAREGTR